MELEEELVVRNCLTCGHRKGGFDYGKCMLSGYYCAIERRYPTMCGDNFDGWIPRPKRKGLKQWLKSIWDNS